MSRILPQDAKRWPQHRSLKKRLLHHFFEAQVRRRPHHTAIDFLDERVTYAKLDCEANRVANYLVGRGVRAGSLVGLCLSKSPLLYAAMLGILKAGAGYVPIDPRLPIERIRAIAEDAQLDLILTEAQLADRFTGNLGAACLQLDTEHSAIASQPTTRVVRRKAGATPSSLSYVIYTSGSTGRPKGVMIEHRNAVAFVTSLATVYRVCDSDRVYQGFSTAFDASVEEIWAAFSRGGTLVIPTSDVERSPADVAAFVNEKKLTYFSTVPTMLAMIEGDLPTVRTLVLGGEACSDELVARWATPERRMLNTYGPTEATVVATWSECAVGEPVSIGHALPGYTTYVLDENLRPVQPGETGELFIGGAGVARGYRNLEALTAERFIPNPIGRYSDPRLYRTFDQVRLGDREQLYFIGRLDDQVKLRGFRMELSEIETVLMAHPKIKAAVVTVTGDDQLKDLAAYVVCSRDEGTLPREEVAGLLRQRLPPYMVPQFLDVIDRLPMMPSGKVDRKSLPPPQTLLLGMGPVVAASCALESQIARAWANVFRLPEVSVEADFFLDLGGHSLLAAQVVSQLRQVLSSARLSVRDVYERRTVRELARALKERMGGGNTDPDVATQKSSQKENLPACAAFHSVHPVVRWTTVFLQAVSVAFYYALVAAPITYVALMATAVADGQLAWSDAIDILTFVGFAAWPLMLLFSIALKWIVIGRYKPGRYPLWSFYYFRWWLVTRFQSLSWANMFSGTPLMSLYWRAMGATIGRNVNLRTSHCFAFDLIKIGDGTSVGVETQILGCRVEDGYLIIAPVEIGRDCFIGMHCTLGLDTRMEDGSRLGDMSLGSDGFRLMPGEMKRGSPARPAYVAVPETIALPPSRARTLTFGLLHLALIYAMGYFLIATSLPAIALIVAGFWIAGPLGGIAGVALAVPVGIFTYACSVIVLKKLLGPVHAGTFRVHSLAYLRHWFVSYLLENTKTILLPVYATLFLPPFMRALGAKIGAGCEISTVSHITPDTLEVGAGSFLADSCLVGGERIHAGTIEVGPVRIGTKSFIGNSALVAGGTTVGSNVLIGVASTPPASSDDVPAGTSWLGSPGFELPTTEHPMCFAEEETFRPTRSAVLQRLVTETLRILLPGLILGASAIVMVWCAVIGYRQLPFWGLILTVSVLPTVLASMSILASALVKKVFIGRVAPIVTPLWSRFVWNNELVNGVYETVAAPTMGPLMGTPFIAPCLRVMGCRIGRWCYLETTLFSEFDLVEIGDRASLNLGATVQTHLFEDRVFKADKLKIGDGCTVGNMGVILYGTEMQAGARLGPLSVLMKGEILPTGTCWQGSPCEEVRPPARPQGQSGKCFSTQECPPIETLPALVAWQR